jgi:hypothetical protein
MVPGEACREYSMSSIEQYWTRAEPRNGDQQICDILTGAVEELRLDLGRCRRLLHKLDLPQVLRSGNFVDGYTFDVD